MNDLSGKTAIVTGGASGIGRALSHELARRGVLVTVADIDERGAQRVAQEIEHGGGRAVAAGVDVADRDAVVALVERTGRLDFMFNNAGICIQGEMRDMDFGLWRRIVDVNLWGVIHGAMAAYAVMVRQGFGHIVNVASAAGLIPIPTQAAYTTTKFGVVGLSAALRAEAEPLGVRVSVVCPGLIDTSIVAATRFLNSTQEDVLALFPFKMLPPDRLARIVLKGVARNRAVIVTPWYARLAWWSYRLSPTLVAATLGRRVVRDFGAIRKA